MKNYKNIPRQEFINFFRDDEKLQQLSVDDQVEIFQLVFGGSSDITKKLLEELISDYSVGHWMVIDLNSNKI